MSEELRCYTFTNFMLSPIQQGIQSGHASMELVNRYILEPNVMDESGFVVADWIANHKTIVCLNGGNHKSVQEWNTFFDVGMQGAKNEFPFAAFYEDSQSLGGLITSVAVILPARIFEGSARLRRQRYDETINTNWDYLLDVLRISWTDADGITQVDTFNSWERDLMNRMNKCDLAK